MPAHRRMFQRDPLLNSRPGARHRGRRRCVGARNALDVARHAERWGYSRYWLAEHHSLPGVASAATSVVIAYVAGGTSTIRVGAGGIMLPNHSPLVIAEQFGTLASLFPGGSTSAWGGPRAPIRPPPARSGGRLKPPTRFRPTCRTAGVFPARRAWAGRAGVTGAGLDVPVWILGSSLFGAQLAAAMGLPFAFASHFAPALMTQAVCALPRRISTVGAARASLRHARTHRGRGPDGQ